MKHLLKSTIICGTLALPFTGLAQSTFTVNSSADSFLDANNPTKNYGHAGTLAIAPVGSSVGEIDSVMQFNLGAATSQFNTDYGAGNWTITGISFSFASQFGTNGASGGNGILPIVNTGSFNVDWISVNNWLEGTGNGMGANNTVTGAVTYNSIPTLLGSTVDLLGTFNYNPPGNNVYTNYSLPLDSNLESEIDSGGTASFFLYATNSTIGYLLNSKDFGSNVPELNITVTGVPEPGTLALAAVAVTSGLVCSRKIRRRK